MTPELEKALKAINAILRFLLTNSTDLTQTCDRFVIQAIKYAWRKTWDSWKAARALQGEFRNGI